MICNKDCFNCPYEDCINDRLDAEDYKASDRRDRMTGNERKQRTPEQIERSRAKQREYYYANREQEIARRKKWVEENRERDRAYQREYRKKNPVTREKAHEHYMEHREEKCAYSKAYYAAHREEILAKSKEKRKKGKVEK